MSKRNKKNNRKYKRNHKKRSNNRINNINNIKEENNNSDNVYWTFLEHLGEKAMIVFDDIYTEYGDIEPFRVCFYKYEEGNPNYLTAYDWIDMDLKFLFKRYIYLRENEIRKVCDIDINKLYNINIIKFEGRYMNQIIGDYYNQCLIEFTKMEYIDFSKPFLCCIPFVPFCERYISKFLKEEKLIKEN